MKREDIEILLGESDEIDEVALFEKIKEAESIKSVIEKEKQESLKVKIENWERENLERIKNEYEEKLKRQSSKSPEQIKIEELAMEVEKIKAEKNQKTLETMALKELQNNGLSQDILDFIMDKDEDSIKNKIYKFRDAVEKEARKTLEDESKTFVKKPELGLSGVPGNSQKNYAGTNGIAAYLADKQKKR